MGGWHPSRLAEQIASISVVWLIVWLGLAALTIALLLLALTRWGQSRPLRKCAMLSLLAHVLLGCIATTIKIVNDTAGSPDAQVMRVRYVASAEDDESQDEQSAAKKAQPWEVLHGREAELPTQTPERPDDAQAAEAKRSQPKNLDEAPGPLESQPVEHGKPALDDPLADRLAAGAPTPPARRPEPLDPPSPQKRDVPNDLPSTDLDRTRDESLATAEPTPREPRDEPSPLLDKIQPPPEWSDPKPTLDSAVALPGLRDRLTRPTTPDSADANSHPANSAAQTSPDIADSIRDLVGGANSDATAAASAASGGSPLVPVPHDLGDRRHMPDLYKERVAPDREKVARKFGGGPDTEAAVEAALRWLAANQAAHGGWDAVRHGAGREDRPLGQDRQGAGLNADTGVTGLAVLAFLGAGHTQFDGPYRQNVARAIQYLKASQARDGNLAGRSTLFARMYCHGMASFALSEAYAMTGDRELRPAVEAAVAYTVAAQNRNSGGWRYQPGDEGDTSQLGWQVMALRSAQLAGIDVPEATMGRARRFLELVSAGPHRGLASYRPQHAITASMTAEALYCRILLQAPANEMMFDEASRFLLAEPPSEKEKLNLYYWYYATLALHQLQGDAWDRWNEVLKPTLIGSQRKDGDMAGSWDADTVWGGYGGRVYTTSMAALCLEVYYRYLPLQANGRREGLRR